MRRLGRACVLLLAIGGIAPALRGGAMSVCVGLASACGDSSADDDASDPDESHGGRGGGRAGSSASGSSGRTGSRAGTGGAAGSSGRGGSAGATGASGRGGSAGSTGPLRDIGYVGCPDFFNCACLIGGDQAQPWHVCAPPCGPMMSACDAPADGDARAECQLQPVDVLGRRFLAPAEGGCVLHCDGGRSCPDGLTCMAGGQGTELCVAPGVVPYPAVLAPAAAADEAPVLAAPLSALCDAGVVEQRGELSDDDPLHARAAQDASGCMLAPDGSRYHYDLYAYELVGDGPHELTVDTCGSPTMFDTVINVYQDRAGSASPLDIADPCPHLLVAADDSVYCENDSSSLVRMTGLVAGVVQVMVTSFEPDVTGTYQLSVESPTSTCR